MVLPLHQRVCIATSLNSTLLGMLYDLRFQIFPGEFAT